MSNTEHCDSFRFRRDGQVLRLLVCLALILCVCASLVSAATFTASLDRDTITLGESVRLQLAFQGANPTAVPQVPQVPNLQIHYIGPASSFSMINGEVSSSVTHSFSVSARAAGEFTIPAFQVQIGSERFTSLPLKLTVLKPGTAPSDAVTSGTQAAFMKLVAPSSLYLGETLVAELQIYFNSRLAGRGNPQLTALPAEGFNVGKMVERPASHVQVGTGAYSMIPVSIPLKPVKTGTLTIGPVTASVVVQIPSANPRPRSMLDQFFGGGGEQRQLTMATEELKIEVLPLPTENVPPNFNHAVGQFTMKVDAGPTNVAVGDPVTVRVQISGQGNLDTLTLPDQPGWQGFKTYPPTSKIDSDDPLGLRGVKTFEQVVVPEAADIKQLPGMAFAFFDPQAKAYRTLQNPPLPLTIRPVGAVAAPTIVTKRDPQNEPPPAQDIVNIKQRPGTLAQAAQPLVYQPWFLVVNSVPVLSLIAAFVWRRRADALANNPRLRRQKQVERIVQEGLVELQQHARAKDSDQFFATLVRLLQEQIGERLDAPASSITEGVADEQLRPRKVDAELVKEIETLFQACNQARYAPVRSSAELEAIVPKAQSVLQRLQSLKLKA